MQAQNAEADRARRARRSSSTAPRPQMYRSSAPRQPVRRHLGGAPAGPRRRQDKYLDHVSSDRRSIVHRVKALRDELEAQRKTVADEKAKADAAAAAAQAERDRIAALRRRSSRRARRRRPPRPPRPRRSTSILQKQQLEAQLNVAAGRVRQHLGATALRAQPPRSAGARARPARSPAGSSVRSGCGSTRSCTAAGCTRATTCTRARARRSTPAVRARSSSPSPQGGYGNARRHRPRRRHGDAVRAPVAHRCERRPARRRRRR